LLPVLFLTGSLFTIFFVPFADAVTNTQTVTASSSIPLGPIDLLVDYSLELDVSTPSEVTAGNSDKITVSPRTGQLLFSIMVEGKRLGPFPYDMILGTKTDIDSGIPLITLFAKPVISIRPQVTGPAQISPQYVVMDSMTSKEFSVYVKDDIGNYDSVNIHFPVNLNVEVGATVGALFLTQDFSEILTIPMNPTFSESFDIKKYYDTDLSLQVREGSSPGSINVNPTLSYDGGNSLPSSVSINVDGVYNTKVDSNQWSSDIQVDGGPHNVQAFFSETIDPSNRAIIYQSSNSGIQSIVTSSPAAISIPSFDSMDDSTLLIILVIVAAAAVGIIIPLILRNKKRSGAQRVQNLNSGTPVQTSQVCNNCGSAITRGSKFCRKCGTTTVIKIDETQLWVCPQCGTTVTQGSKFCGKCGKLHS